MLNANILKYTHNKKFPILKHDNIRIVGISKCEYYIKTGDILDDDVDSNVAHNYVDHISTNNGSKKIMIPDTKSKLDSDRESDQESESDLDSEPEYDLMKMATNMDGSEYKTN
jgi:hypothetical protein